MYCPLVKKLKTSLRGYRVYFIPLTSRSRFFSSLFYLFILIFVLFVFIKILIKNLNCRMKTDKGRGQAASR